MGWLNFFSNDVEEVKHNFGRGINATASIDEEELFDNSYKAFEKKEILDAYDYFFKSLENFHSDISNENISSHRDGNTLEFVIYQGLAKIRGHITQEYLSAEVILSKKESSHVALKRYILERNYQFTYINYFSDDTHLKLKLYLDNITINPYKIFYPLRELALSGDFDKSFTKSEFCDIEIEDIEHIEPIDRDEVELKYNYMKSLIDSTTQKTTTFPSNDNAGMKAFSYLYLLLKIDYLIAPKYKIKEKITKKINNYFRDEDSSMESKNDKLKEYVEILNKMEFDEFYSQFYEAKYSFNSSEKTSHEDINSFIIESIAKIRWYKNNRYNQVIPTIYRYIAFYTLYNYGLHPVTKGLLHTLVEIQNSDFFELLEYPILYSQESETFSKKAIISKIEDIIFPHQEKFKLLEPFGHELNFNSLNEFSNSFYLQVVDLNFEEI